MRNPDMRAVFVVRDLNGVAARFECFCNTDGRINVIGIDDK